MPKLTTRRVVAVSSPGRYGDGDGLYPRVADGGSKQWLFRYILDKRERQMGLGPIGEPPAGVTLAMAHGLAAQARGVLREGRDPLKERGREKAKAARAITHTFQTTAEAMLVAKAGE